MARAPRATINPGMVEPRTDPLDEAVIIDQEGIAGNLTEVLEKLSAYDSSSIKGVLFQKPKNGVGKFEWIEEISPPFDMSGIMQELKERFGGGDFRLSIFAGGKVRKHIEFSIVREKTTLVAPPKTGDDNMMMFMQMMMNNQQESARESRAAADRQMQMMMQMQNQSSENSRNSMTAIVTMMTAGMGNQPKVTDFLPMMMNKGESGSLKEMVETLVALKGITEPAAPGFDADNIVGSVLKIAGPVAGAIGKAASGVMERRQQGQQQSQTIQLQEQPTSLEFPTLPGPQAQNPTQALPAPVGGPAALIALIRPDVNYFFGRRHDVELAAEAVYGVISAGLDSGQVTESDLNDMVTAFMGSPDWVGELAGAGVDLRADPAWAQSFLFALVAEHTNAGSDPGGEFDPDQGNDDFRRPNGGGPDLGADGQAQPPGLNLDEGASIGCEPDNGGI